MSTIAKMSYAHFFTNVPTNESLHSIKSTVSTETAKLAALRLIQVTTVVGLLALGGLAAFSLLKVGTIIGMAKAGVVLLGTGYVAQSAFSQLEASIQDRKQKKQCLRLFEKLHPDLTPKSDFVPLEPYEFFEEGSIVQEKMIDLAYPQNPSKLFIEVEAQAKTEKIGKEADTLSFIQPEVSRCFFELEPKIRHLLTKLSPEQREFAYLRLNQFLYAKAKEDLKIQDSKEAKKTSWVPSKKTLDNIVTEIHKEASKILMLQIAKWAIPVAFVALGIVGTVLFAASLTQAHLLIIGMIAAGEIAAISATFLLTNQAIEKKKELVKSYILFHDFKSNAQIFAKEEVTQKNFSLLMGDMKDYSTHHAFDVTVLKRVPWIYQLLGSYYATTKNLGATLRSKLVTSQAHKDEINFEKNFPNEKAVSILNNHYFSHHLNGHQKVFWSLKVGEAFIRETLDDIQQCTLFQKDLKKTEATIDIRNNQWRALDLFSQSAFVLANELEFASQAFSSAKNLPVGDLRSAIRDFLDNIKTRYNSGHHPVQVVKSIVGVSKAIQDGSGKPQQDHNFFGEKPILDLEAISQLISNGRPGSSEYTSPELITVVFEKLRSVLLNASNMPLFKCHSTLDLDVSDPHDEPMLNTDLFLTRMHEIYETLLHSILKDQKDSAFAKALQSDPDLVKRAQCQFAALVREHAKLFGKVLDAKNAKSLFERDDKKVIEKATAFVKKVMKKEPIVTKLIASDEIDPDRLNSIGVHLEYVPNIDYAPYLWNEAESRFVSSLTDSDTRKKNGLSIIYLQSKDRKNSNRQYLIPVSRSQEIAPIEDLNRMQLELILKNQFPPRPHMHRISKPATFSVS